MATRQVDGLLTEWVDGELLVLKPSTNETHALNETAAIVFELCDGAATRAGMTAEVARRTGAPVDQSIVDLALAELERAGLVATDDAERPTIRDLVRTPGSWPRGSSGSSMTGSTAA